MLRICYWLLQREAVGQKIGFVHFSLQLINNNFCIKCWKNYYFIFVVSIDINFIMSSYSEVQLREKRVQSLLIQLEILSSACAFNLEFVGITKAKCRSEAAARVNA